MTKKILNLICHHFLIAAVHLKPRKNNNFIPKSYLDGCVIQKRFSTHIPKYVISTLHWIIK